MIIKRICILGGTGFVGRTLANHLTRAGYRLRLLTRNREAHRRDLIVLPELELTEADSHDPEQLQRHFNGCEAVINLVGILNEKGRDGSGFRRAHVELPRKVLDACRANGIRRLLHMSALNADPDQGPSHYLRTKGEAEEMVHAAANMQVTSFRPSVIFGPGDAFFNQFARLLKLAPGVFPLACAGTRFAPVYVEDVAAAFTGTLTDPRSYGQRYDLCGPGQYTLGQLVEYTARCTGRPRIILPLPDTIARVQAAMFDFVPGKPFSTDNYLSATVDSICACDGLEHLGIRASSVEAVVPGYLARG